MATPTQIATIGSAEDGLRLAVRGDRLQAIFDQSSHSHPRRIHVISICGPARHGRSFLINILRQCFMASAAGLDDIIGTYVPQLRLDGFKWGYGQDSITSGIWMTNSPITMQLDGSGEIDVYFIDTQGVLDEFSTAEENQLILQFCMQVSNTLIFSVPQELSDDKLTAIATALDASTRSVCNHLYVVIRDVGQHPIYAQGETGGQMYLNKRLEANQRFSADANRLREILRTKLAKIDCTRLPSPGPQVNSPDYAGGLGLYGNFTRFLEEFALSLITAVNSPLEGSNRWTSNDFMRAIQNFGSNCDPAKPAMGVPSHSRYPTTEQPVTQTSEGLLQEKYDQCASEYERKLKAVIESTKHKYLEPNNFNLLHEELSTAAFQELDLEISRIQITKVMANAYRRELYQKVKKHQEALATTNTKTRDENLRRWSAALNGCNVSYTEQIQELCAGTKKLLKAATEFDANTIGDKVKQHFLTLITDMEDGELLAKYQSELEKHFRDVLTTEWQAHEQRRRLWLQQKFENCKTESEKEYASRMRKLMVVDAGDKTWSNEDLELFHLQARKLVVGNAEFPPDDGQDYSELLKQFLDFKLVSIKEQNQLRQEHVIQSKETLVAPAVEQFTVRLRDLVTNCGTPTGFKQATAELKTQTMISFRNNMVIQDETILVELSRELEVQIGRAYESALQDFKRRQESELLAIAGDSYKIKMVDKRQSAPRASPDDMDMFHKASLAEVLNECRQNPQFDQTLQQTLMVQLESWLPGLKRSAAEYGEVLQQQDEEFIRLGTRKYIERIQMAMKEEQMQLPTPEAMRALHSAIVKDVVGELETNTHKDVSEELKAELGRALTSEQLPEFQRKAAAILKRCKHEADFFMKKAVVVHKSELETISHENCASKDELNQKHLQILESAKNELIEAMQNLESKITDQTFIQSYVDQLTAEATLCYENYLRVFQLQLENHKIHVQVQISAAKQAYDSAMDKHFKKTPFIQRSAFQSQSSRIISELVKKYGSQLKGFGSEELRVALEELYPGYEERNAVNTPTKDVAIGIDLGTTYSCVSVFRNGKPHIVPSGVSGNTVPSFVAFTKAGELVGAAAKNQAHENPADTIFDAKRLIGRDFSDPKVQDDMKLWPFQVVEKPESGKPMIMAAGVAREPEFISSKVLKHLKTMAQNHLNVPNIEKAVITVPAYFSEGQRQATKDAGFIAGLEVLQVLSEPTAAAMAYYLHRPTAGAEKKRNILVFDFGGGTFDVSVLQIDGHNINVKAVKGDTHLGGEDIDQTMLEFALDKFKTTTGVDIAELKRSGSAADQLAVARQLRRIRDKCEGRKKDLSEAEHTTIALAEVFGHDLNVEMTRAEFEEINREKFELTIEIVGKALEDANLRTDQIDEIILIGGSTKIPKVQQLLSDYFGGRGLYKTLNPDEAVAHGAAILAAKLNGEAAGLQMVFKDVTPLSLGIEVLDESHSVIIPKNTPVPARMTREYYTSKDNQTAVSIRIYEGEDGVAAKNHFLGSFGLTDIPPAPKGKEPIEATMEINSDGILHVTARCKSTGGSKDLVVKTEKGRLTKEKMIELREQLAGN